MSYGEKYNGGWSSKSLKGHIYIDEEDYAGSSTSIQLTDDDIHITRNFSDWEQYIIGMTLSFEVFNDKTDFFDLMELMTATERQFKVRVVEESDSDTITLFEGFLNVDIISQKYLKRQRIRLVASSYVSKLKHLYPISIDTLQNMTFIDIIDEILRGTGAYYDIRVNASLYAKDDVLDAGQTLFSKNGFFTEVFWENNIDRKNSLEILKSILKTFDCYLYWWDEHWYIEQREDIWSSSIDYVEYTTGTSAGYSPDDTGNVVNVNRSTTDDLHSLEFVELSQILRIIPGNRLIRVNVNVEQGLLLNLTINDFEDAVAVSGSVPYPDLRTWQYYDDSDVYLVWVFAGVHNNISNCMLRQFWSHGIDYIGGNWIFSPHLIEWERGLYTRFYVTIDEETKLKIKFKFEIYDWAYPFSGNWEDYEFEFNYYLRMPTGNNYVMYNDSTETWEVVSSNEADALQTHIVDGTNFDVSNNSVEVTIPIPLSDLGSGYYGNQDFVLGICTERIIIKNGMYHDVPAKLCYYGDVYLTVNSTLQDGVIEGEYKNTNFLDKKEIDLDIFDITNENYKNGVLRGSSLEYNTEEWTRDGVNYFTIVEWMLKNKFVIHNASRQKVLANVHSTDILQPMQLYIDSKQSDKKFIMMSIEHLLTQDIYRVVLFEHDTTTTINLIEE